MKLLRWEDTLLTPEEEREALTEAGIPLDPSEWSAEDMERAAAALDRMQLEVLAEKRTGGRRRQ